MRINEIEQLLPRYYNGDTSEDEEKELKRFFAEEDIPAHLLAEKEIFMQLAAPAGIPEGMESRLSRKIDEWDTHEKHVLKAQRKRRILRLRWIGNIAASLLILFATGMYLQQPHHAPTPQDTCATPEEAYAQAQKALVMLSASLNKGMEKMEVVQETTGKIEENMNKQLNRINIIKP